MNVEAEKRLISAPQFFVMMFVSRVVTVLGSNARYLGEENMLEAVVSWTAAMAAGLLLSLPVWAMHRQCPECPVGDMACKAFGGAGKLVPLLYIVYFIVSGGISLAMFETFLQDVVNPDFSGAVILCAILAVVIYGAGKGIETVARCGACVFAIFLVGAGLIFGITAFRFSPENLEPVFQNGSAGIWQGMGLFLARTSAFADMAVLFPMVRGKKVRAFLGWAGGTTVFTALLFTLLAGCLGPYASTQSFPVYVLSSLTEVRSMQRLDALFAGLWMMGILIKLSCELYACRICFASVFGKKRPKTAVLFCGGAVLILAIAAAESRRLREMLFDTRLLLPATVITGGLLPLMVFLGHRARFGKRRKENEE